ncbi:phosphoadenylyl-sulfate reductase [Sphingobacterium psychroaquaticum]|uniref:Adenosine 5'-phosphosulfate reductase n=1 Tax=Sphingobacterium psychroaquaticum TaxID=561061 RepID=A0A1X7IJ80_9SPHI|nr:phosphoadenylyl-sulfate reductase [Sphingobacterium psychroaquaticum]QBQ41499.1 phosphoadenylyl-sulfate reductase [Sphingobacterium psychroaquaticum]SMG14435.1 phosphoadenosine phosphosulfate reductase [Sphingobacterium psychroaquaticum]
MIITEIEQAIENLTALDILQYVDTHYGDRAVFSTSFGIEDQVITHLLGEIGSRAHLFTLETGRLFPETYYVWNRTLERYNLPIKAYYPNTEAVEKMVTTKGPSSFYESVENRKECCFIRKIEPLQRAVRGYEIWITGIRAAQSANREDMNMVEWDEGNKIIKIHPLFHWSQSDVEDFLQTNNVPYNPLHDRGFPSIGCQPCTRAIQPDEDFRAGRWWWEDKSKKECGLHIVQK